MSTEPVYEYKVEPGAGKRKRVCLTLDLKNRKDLIEKYKHYHQPENNWPEINQGIKNAGILKMDIYLLDNRMFMICEIDENDNFLTIWQKIATYPRQDEWFQLMCNFIEALPGHKLDWVPMEKVFELPG